ncbi:MAG: DUF6134 family protein [Bacteroidia bacterium]
MKKIVLLSFLAFFLLFTAEAQKLKYTVRLKNDVVGSMQAERTQGTRTKIRIDSHILIQMLLRLDLEYFMESVFEKGILVISQTVQKANGKEHANTTTSKEKEGYKVVTQKETKVYPHNEIRFNLCRLYYEEPGGITEVWSDTYGKMLKIKPAGKNRYELMLPDGKSNYYSYYKGICTLVETELPIGKVTFQLSK